MCLLCFIRHGNGIAAAAAPKYEKVCYCNNVFTLLLNKYVENFVFPIQIMLSCVCVLVWVWVCLCTVKFNEGLQHPSIQLLEQSTFLINYFRKIYFTNVITFNFLSIYRFTAQSRSCSPPGFSFFFFLPSSSLPELLCSTNIN